jgi:hypothetical protein
VAVSADVTAALVAGSVSLVVAAVTVTLTVVTTRATLRREHERQQTELRRRMTDRLYDRRVATYPALFAATSAFRRSKMDSASDLSEHLRAAISTIDNVHAGELGLLLSAHAHRCLLELRRAVRLLTDAPVGGNELVEATHGVWLCKNELRAALRADLGLLFDEEPGVGWQQPVRPGA